MKEVAKSRARGANILVIVYEHILRDILTRILINKGHKVVTCSAGFNGIRTLEKWKGKFDLVLIDIHLPDIGGLSVAKKVKKISQKTPVVLIKGWGKKLDTKELKNSGADLIISKPFYLDKALDIVENAMVTV
jgi:DNA-binding NtrC family response regulator